MLTFCTKIKERFIILFINDIIIGINILTIFLKWHGNIDMVMTVLWFGGVKNDINHYIRNTGVYEEVDTC